MFILGQGAMQYVAVIVILGISTVASDAVEGKYEEIRGMQPTNGGNVRILMLLTKLIYPRNSVTGF